MPELPEIASRAREMQAALVGKTIVDIEIFQPKCLNLTPEEFTQNLHNASIRQVTNRGKWLFVETSRGYLLLNLGMGGEVLLTNRRALPEKVRLIFDFEDDTCLAVNFWWFGYAHYVPLGDLAGHEMTAKLGPNALEVTPALLKDLIGSQRTRVKSFLLDQTKLAGIGNAYVHDILFLARLHPLRPLNTLTEAEIEALAAAIVQGLRPSLEKGGAFYEVDLFGNKGGFTMDEILIGYREGSSCPNCATPIEKIKTGSTSSFICPQCQPLIV